MASVTLAPTVTLAPLSPNWLSIGYYYSTI